MHNNFKELYKGLLLIISTMFFLTNCGMDLFSSSEKKEIDNEYVKEKCNERTINFYPDGKLQSCRLNEEIEIQGMMVKADRIRFYENGQIDTCVLFKDMDVQGYPCKKESISFYENGKLKHCYLSKNKNIGDLTAKADKITFYESGKVEKFDLAIKASIKGFKFAAGTTVKLFEEGHAKSCIIYEPTILFKQVYPADTTIFFNKNDKGYSIYLTVPMEIESETKYTGQTVCFDEKGKVIECPHDKDFDF